MPQIHALIPAAGSGTRMGCAIPKQYVQLHGRPMLWHSAHSLRSHPRIDRVAIVIDETDSYWQSLNLSASLSDCTLLRCGGTSRAQTVLNGLQALRGQMHDDDWVLVHDAARPCLEAAALNRLFHSVLDDDVGGLLAIPVRDTLKLAQPDGRVQATRAREGLWQAQTPQMFRYGLLLRALTVASASPDATAITDEASAVEALGLHPLLVQGSARNIKVTYPEDVDLAQQFLAK